MPDSSDLNYLFFGLNPVYKATRPTNNFADVRIVKFGNYSARLWKLGEPFHYSEQAADKFSSRDGIILGDVGGETLEIEPSGGRPNQSVSHSANSSLI